MIDKGTKNVLGIMVNAVDYEAAVDKVVSKAEKKEGMSVSALAVHGVMTGVLDPVHRYRLNHLDLVVPDGQPVRMALNLLHGTQLKDRVYGPNLTMKLCERAAKEGLPVYFYGSRQIVLEKLCHNLLQRFPSLQIVGAEPSKFRTVTTKEKDEIATRIKESGASITFVGLGCPRQEVWAFEYRDAINMPLIAVGAAFDFHAGLLPQAPSILQQCSLEWLFRLLHEPKRLWRRYLYLNPLYLWYLFLQYLKLRDFDPEHAVAPAQDMFYG